MDGPINGKMDRPMNRRKDYGLMLKGKTTTRGLETYHMLPELSLSPNALKDPSLC